MYNFTDESMDSIIHTLSHKLQELKDDEILSFTILDPDNTLKSYAGQKVTIEDKVYLYRSYKSWCDLAELLGCRILTPKTKDDNHIIIRYKKLNTSSSFHKSDLSKEEKYGTDSQFSLINKSEEPSFLYYYQQALKNVQIDKRKRVLNLGVNTGDEFDTIINTVSDISTHHLVGIDYSPSAIDSAKIRFEQYENIDLYTHDINDLDTLKLEPFDLIVTIGTLQSTSLEFKPLFMKLVQENLKKDGSLILGFPNCRWIDTQMVYGAVPPNYNFSEMSILYKDVQFCKKYLQQKKFRVTITGKDYIFL
ncbi:MAG: methyltransferase domain-containing protein, partial [Campylobacterota bacterium]|nr:methyltransferase domain-containing protein [Campylobacterota bacterium]